MFSTDMSTDELKENIADVLEMYLEDVWENYKPDGNQKL